MSGVGMDDPKDDMHDSAGIAALLADIDGTLLTKDKVLTARTIRAVATLRERGIVFTVTSGRPPFGMQKFVEPLGLTMPMAAFNGGAIVLPDLSVLDERVLPEYLLPAILDMIEAHGLDVFVFRSSDWYVRSPTAPRVSRETSNVGRAPVVVGTFDDLRAGVVKIVGVSEDLPRVAVCEAAMRRAFGDRVSAARSAPHYLDVTHPGAHKGVVVERLSRYLEIPLDQIAVIGDQPNDVLMFERAGISIAMGNASDEVQRRATYVTASFRDEGFARAVDELVLPRGAPPGGPAVKPTGRLHHLGQSLWLDGVRRDRLDSGALARDIGERSVTGLVSNAVVWAKAVATSSAYDTTIADGTRRGRSGEGLLVELAIEDLRRAADLLRPIHDRSAGVDGWVTLPTTPARADDFAGTLAAAKALFTRVNRANCMIEIAGTPLGLTVVEELIFAGVPVSVGALFSREQYLGAAEAYLRGVERRVDAGLRPDVASVACMGIPPWDAAVAGRLPPALGGLGVAMAQRTYAAYRDVLRSPRWQRLYNRGGRPQRLLWDIAESARANGADLTYATALTAQFTVLALRESALEALADHGEITTLLRADGGASDEVLARVRAAGIDLYALALQLQEDAMSSRTSAWDGLVTAIGAKAARLSRFDRSHPR
jgi:transaldolase